MAAARAWVLGAAADEVDGDDLAAAGMAPEEIDRLRAVCGAAGQGESELALFPGNVTAVEAFVAQAGRWRYTPHGDPDGLDMQQVESTLRLMGVKRRRRTEVYWQIRTMERAAVDALREETGK